TVDLTLSVAVQPTESLSFGAGFIYERAEATLSKAIDFGTAICAQAAASVPTSPANTCFNPNWALYPLYHPQSADGSFEVQGSDTSTGFVLGMLYTPNDFFALGISYRS